MTGILWMDDSDGPVARKIAEAAKRYRYRFGLPATLCYANPKDLPEPVTIGGIRVEPRNNILPHHFLVGREAGAAPTEERAA